MAVIAAAWLPFYVADPGTMTAAHYTIRNLPTSALRALGVTAAWTPSWDRPAQVALGWALGAAAVWRRRWPAVILLGVGARIALDPGVHGYYTAGVMVGALIWDAIGARRPWPVWSLLCILALSGIPVVTRDPQVLGDARLAIVVAFTAALLLGPSRWVWQAGPGPRQPSGSARSPRPPWRHPAPGRPRPQRETSERTPMDELSQPEGDDALPLRGILVVALEQAVAVPFATRQLADLGARVIKVERRGTGDFARGYDRAANGQSSYFVWLNRAKESIELDVKDDGDRAVLSALLNRAGVFVQNLAPGAADRLGLSGDLLREHHPALITCSVSGYGAAGPYRNKKAYDLLVQAEAGLLSITGSPDAPAKAGISVADIAAGMYAYSGILAALYERQRTGRGISVDVSLLEALGEWMSQPVYFTGDGQHPARRTGARHTSISPYGPYAAGGGQVFIGVQNEREWALLCRQILRRPELICDERFATNPDRVAHDRELTAIIEHALAGIAPGGSPRCWTRRASPMRGCAPRRSSPPTRSSRRGTGGGRWIRPTVPSGRCSRR